MRSQILLALPLIAAALPSHASTLTYLTDFTKTSSIYSNLNQQFPNAGPGVPGSRVGTANTSIVYTPYTFSPSTDLAGSDGGSYKIASDANGHDFAEFGAASFGLPGSVTVNAAVRGATTVYALLAAYNGVAVNVAFTGANGTALIVAGNIPDFNGGGSQNNCYAFVCDQTVFRVTDIGAGGSGNSSNGAYNSYDLTQLRFTLPAAFAGTMLTSIKFSTDSYEGLLLGVSALGASPTATPEPASMVLFGLAVGAAGLAAGKRRRG